MAEVAIDEQRAPRKTMRWWDGFVIGLASPGFLLIGLWGSIIALGGWVAAVLFVISATIGALQARLLRAGGHVPGQAGRALRLRARGVAQVLLARGTDRRVRLLVRLVERARHLRQPDRLPAHRLVRRGGLLRDRELGSAPDPPPRVAAADRGHVHRPLLGLQHLGMRPPSGSATSSAR
jgi:hypothetical protein